MIKKAKCFVLTGSEGSEIMGVFGEAFWNDVEDIYCVPIALLKKKDIEDIRPIIPNVEEVDYLIIEVDKLDQN